MGLGVVVREATMIGVRAEVGNRRCVSQPRAGAREILHFVQDDIPVRMQFARHATSDKAGRRLKNKARQRRCCVTALAGRWWQEILPGVCT